MLGNRHNLFTGILRVQSARHCSMLDLRYTFDQLAGDRVDVVDVTILHFLAVDFYSVGQAEFPTVLGINLVQEQELPGNHFFRSSYFLVSDLR